MMAFEDIINRIKRLQICDVESAPAPPTEATPPLPPPPPVGSEECKVYVSYDIDDPPPHPGDKWTRFVCISDTHSRWFQVPPGDVLLHSGDLSSWGEYSQLEDTIDWIKTLPHPTKIITAGNHDLCLDPDWAEDGSLGLTNGGGIPQEEMAAAQNLVRGQEALDAGIHYLEHQSMRFTTAAGKTWEVYGSPAAPRYAVGAFQYLGGRKCPEGVKIYAQIPTSTQILLTHTPPQDICDVTKRGKHAGCQALRARLDSPGLSNCRLHVFGHIHEAQGVDLTPLASGEGRGTQRFRVSVNAAMHHNYPAIVDLLN